MLGYYTILRGIYQLFLQPFRNFSEKNGVNRILSAPSDPLYVGVHQTPADMPVKKRRRARQILPVRTIKLVRGRIDPQIAHDPFALDIGALARPFDGGVLKIFHRRAVAAERSLAGKFLLQAAEVFFIENECSNSVHLPPKQTSTQLCKISRGAFS